jgi:phosphopantothenoylcysteine decarboxylase/phosphopantothenate--cysteine ligase
MTASPLAGKKIILAITGSIAAYKTPALVRLLLKAGAEVRVLMTAAAADMVSPLVLATLSKHPVHQSVHNGSDWSNHVELGLWADAMLIAPCSANSLAKLAHGLCDTVVSAVYLSARCPVFVAPAMDVDMWHHPSTQANVATLKTYGNHLVPVGFGELASGLVGEGRMAEPEELVGYLEDFFRNAGAGRPLAGKQALVTAGPTYERIDPVRFIGNFSTGKMGIAIAEALAQAGATVHLVLGPTYLSTSRPGITTYRVESAQQMYDRCIALFPDCTVAVMAAAVADYRPIEQASSKIKKASDAFQLSLTQNPDILAQLGQLKKPHQYLVGFALETHNEEAYAQEKRVRKAADLIVLNSLQDAGAGFATDTNKVNFVTRQGIERLPLLPKTEVAHEIVQFILQNLPSQRGEDSVA